MDDNLIKIAAELLMKKFMPSDMADDYYPRRTPKWLLREITKSRDYCRELGVRVRRQHDSLSEENQQLQSALAEVQNKVEAMEPIIKQIASLYSGKAVKNDFTELVINGHVVYLAQQALTQTTGAEQ